MHQNAINQQADEIALLSASCKEKQKFSFFPDEDGRNGNTAKTSKRCFSSSVHNYEFTVRLCGTKLVIRRNHSPQRRKLEILDIKPFMPTITTLLY